MNKVLFLDFDGVLNTPMEAYDRTLNENLVQLVGNFCYKNNISVVFSTAWRLYDQYNTVDKLKDVLMSFGFPEEVECIGKTPDLSFMLPKGEHGYHKTHPFPLRSYEIRNYLKENPEIRNYVAIDDMSALFLDEENVVITNDLLGATKKDLEKVLNIFHKNEKSSQKTEEKKNIFSETSAFSIMKSLLKKLEQ